LADEAIFIEGALVDFVAEELVGDQRLRVGHGGFGFGGLELRVAAELGLELRVAAELGLERGGKVGAAGRGGGWVGGGARAGGDRLAEGAEEGAEGRARSLGVLVGEVVRAARGWGGALSPEKKAVTFFSTPSRQPRCSMRQAAMWASSGNSGEGVLVRVSTTVW